MNKIAMIFFGAVMLCGCVKVDYTGQKFPATPLSQEVKYFSNRKQIPVDEYTIIGRFTLTAPLRSDGYTFQAKLLEEGRKYGGDAVCRIDVKTVSRGAYARNDEEFGAPRGAAKPTVSESPRGDPSPLVGEYRSKQQKVVRALLLKKRTEVEKILK